MSEALDYSQLLAFEQQITELLEQLQQEEFELLAGNLSEQDVELQKQSEEVANELTAQLAACREALVRIETGKYGRCDRCNEVIELNHLMADPTVCRCVRCRRKDAREQISMP